MIAVARKDLAFFILKHTSPPVCRSPIYFSPCLCFFSTSRETKLCFSPAVIDILVHKHEFSPELASRVASAVTRLRNPENGVSVLSFFKEIGFSDTQLEKIVKFGSRIMAGSVEDGIKPKIKILQDLGFSSGEICKIISSDPPFLMLSVKNNIIPSLSVLKGLLGSNNEVAKVISRSPRVLQANFQNTVIPNVEFYKSCGIPMERIRIILTGFPCTFSLKPETIRKSAEKAKEMGLDATSKSFLYAIPTIASMSNEVWEVKLQAFRDLGFSESDILTIFRKAPQAFSVSTEKAKKVVERLLGSRKFNISSIVNSPQSLLCSIEKKYMPRLQILGILESRNLIKEWPALGTICGLSDDKFFGRFIRPYLDEVSDVCPKAFSHWQKGIKP